MSDSIVSCVTNKVRCTEKRITKLNKKVKNNYNELINIINKIKCDCSGSSGTLDIDDKTLKRWTAITSAPNEGKVGYWMGGNPETNVRSGTWSAVSGGSDNTAFADYSNIGGGRQNTIEGQ